MRRCQLMFVASAVLGCACSSSSPAAPSAPELAPQTVTASGRVDAFGIIPHELTATRSGTLTATLTWSAAVDLDLYLTDAGCAGYPPDACAILARSVEEAGTREELTRAAREGERYKLWVDNLSRTAEADYTLAVVVR